MSKITYTWRECSHCGYKLDTNFSLGYRMFESPDISCPGCKRPLHLDGRMIAHSWSGPIWEHLAIWMCSAPTVLLVLAVALLAPDNIKYSLLGAVFIGGILWIFATLPLSKTIAHIVVVRKLQSGQPLGKFPRKVQAKHAQKQRRIKDSLVRNLATADRQKQDTLLAGLDPDDRREILQRLGRKGP